MLRIIILNYKRSKNVGMLINAYSNHYPITVINNNPEEPLVYSLYNTDTINNDRNYYCMERWHRCFEFPEPFKLVLDDDIMLAPSLIKKMLALDTYMVGINGKKSVSTATNYSELENVWLEDNQVDFLVGSAILIKQEALNSIEKEINKIGYPERGDDILISYLIKNKYNLSYLPTVSGKAICLPEGAVGLNKDPEHFSKRWKVVEKFKNIGWTGS